MQNNRGESSSMTLKQQILAIVEGALMLATRQGMIKLTALDQFVVRSSRFAAIKLREGDRLLTVRPMAGESNMLMVTASGLAMAFKAEEVSVTGRVSMGVRGVNLSEGDECIAALPFEPEGELLLVSDGGYMKRCLLVDFEIKARGGKGAKCFTLLKTGANGTRIVGALRVRLPYDFMAVQQRSGETRLNTEEIKIESRAAKGTPYLVTAANDAVTEIWEVL